MYLKFPRAAVFVGDPHAKQVPTGNTAYPSQNTPAPCITLWSSRAFSVIQGRAIAVRKTGKVVEVGLVPIGSTSIVWLPSDRVLSPAQITRWLATSSFRTFRAHDSAATLRQLSFGETITLACKSECQAACKTNKKTATPKCVR